MLPDLHDLVSGDQRAGTQAQRVTVGCPSTLEVGAGNADDGIGDCVDNCTEKTNASQTDSNGDGYGNACDPDYNNDGTVGGADLGILKSLFLSPPGPSACAGGSC